MAEEAVLRVKIEEGPASAGPRGAGTPAGKAPPAGAGPQPRGGGQAQGTYHDMLEIAELLGKIFGGGGLTGAIYNVLRTVFGQRMAGGGTRAPSASRAGQPVGPAANVSIRAQLAQITATRWVVQSGQTTIQAASATIYVAGTRPAGPTTPTGPAGPGPGPLGGAPAAPGSTVFSGRFNVQQMLVQSRQTIIASQRTAMQSGETTIRTPHVTIHGARTPRPPEAPPGPGGPPGRPPSTPPGGRVGRPPRRPRTPRPAQPRPGLPAPRTVTPPGGLPLRPGEQRYAPPVPYVPRPGQTVIENEQRRYAPPVPRTGPPAPPQTPPTQTRYGPPGPPGQPIFTYPRPRHPPPAPPTPPSGGGRGQPPPRPPGPPTPPTPPEPPWALPAGGAGALATLGSVASIVGLVVVATNALAQGVGKAVDAVGGLAAALISAQVGVEQPMAQFGGYLRDTGSTLAMFGNGFGVILVEVGAILQNFGKIVDQLSANAERYAALNPDLAVAQAQVQVTRVLNDLRRAQEVSPALTSFLEARTGVEQKLEDIKSVFIQRFATIVTGLLEVIRDLIPDKDKIEAFIIAVQSAIPGLGSAVNDLIREQRRARELDAQRAEFLNPARAILNSQDVFNFFAGGPEPTGSAPRGTGPSGPNPFGG